MTRERLHERLRERLREMRHPQISRWLIRIALITLDAGQIHEGACWNWVRAERVRGEFDQ
jgi:hypothetical protein